MLTDKHESYLPIDTLIFDYNGQAFLKLFLMGMIKHSQSTQSNKFAISLQYLKKQVRDEFHFLHADKHESLYKLPLSFLMEVARLVETTPNRKLVIFLQYLQKKNII